MWICLSGNRSSLASTIATAWFVTTMRSGRPRSSQMISKAYVPARESENRALTSFLVDTAKCRELLADRAETLADRIYKWCGGW